MFSWQKVAFVAALASSAILPASAQTQIVYDSIHNATTIVGTWASGAKHVVTGSGFANPANLSFTYPSTTGVSYSFDAQGHYEIARYRFTANGTEPTCITGVLNWAHGTYSLLANGSIVMTPFGDGYQQVQDPCAAVSNMFENFNYTELYQSWRIFTDPTDGYKLHLFEFDGTPVAPQFQVSTSPNMLPTQMLRNVTAAVTTTDGFVTSENTKRVRRGIVEDIAKRSAGERTTTWTKDIVLGTGAMSVILALVAL